LDARTTAQLDAIAEVGKLLEQAGFEHWLFGGWAVDFHVGHVTREHFDVDFAVLASNAGEAARLLEASGWVHAPEPDEDGGTGYERDGVRVELTFLVRDEDGAVRIRLRRGDVMFAGGPIAHELLDLDDRRCRVIDASALTRTKSVRRDDAEDQAKDMADLAALSEAQSSS